MDRSRRAAMLRDYFDLQLRFAAAMGAATGLPIDAAVLRYTNFHRRFGLGQPEAMPPSADWREYAAVLRGLAGHDARVDWTCAFLVRSPPEPRLPGQTVFGCFACDPPDARGGVRIHFTNREPAGVGPLAIGRAAVRRQELTAMLTYVRRVHADAREIRGGSWLYSREAYRRLFPPAYRDSCEAQAVDDYYQGSSRWGQFLDHREATRPDLRAAFLANLADLDVERPWTAFPIARYRARAPIGAFYDYFDVA